VAPDIVRTRRCIVSGALGAREGLVRFVVGPDNAIIADVAGDLPSRGFWLSASRDIVLRAVKTKSFVRAARAPVTVADGLADQVEALLARRALDLLGLARRASQAVTGFEKVRAAIASGRAQVVIAARDGSVDGRDKLRRLGRGLALVSLFDNQELSLAFGKGNVIHAALAPGRLAERFLMEVARLRGFRPAEAGTAA
jgi:predicted RNA-binding protein YlxR (DUF448 family)